MLSGETFFNTKLGSKVGGRLKRALAKKKTLFPPAAGKELIKKIDWGKKIEPLYVTIPPKTE